MNFKNIRLGPITICLLIAVETFIIIKLTGFNGYTIIEKSTLAEVDQFFIPTSTLSISTTAQLKTDLELDGPPVFLLEISGKNHLKIREACALEAAAKAHPKSPIYMLNINLTLSDSEVNPLPKDPNIRYSPLNISSILEGTILYEWYLNGTHKTSHFPVPHMSDALRITLLYKHGGIYLDTDVITVQPLDTLKNTIGTELDYITNGAVLVFDKSSKFLNTCIEDYVQNFKPDVWGQQGPLLFNRLLRKKCVNATGKHFYKDFYNKPELCEGVRVLSPEGFYPMSYGVWAKLMLKNVSLPVFWSESYAVHLFNNLVANEKPVVGTGIVMDLLADRNCPTIYKIAKKNKLSY